MNKVTKVLFIELKEILLLAVVGALFNVVLYPITVPNMTVSILVWVFLAKGNGYIVDFLDTKISWRDQPITRVLVGITAMVVYTVVIFAIIFIVARWIVADLNPMDQLKAFSPEDFTVALLITLIISMFFHGRAFYLKWKRALEREERLKNETLKSRYESLKNQVNPHFLFNSLNVLTSLVYDDQKKAVAFIRKMSDVYRYVLEQKDQELVELTSELKFVQNYAYLQKIRFSESLQLEVNQNHQNGYVPPLAIQVLIENAIKHNVVSEAKPLKISVEVGEQAVVVENTVQEKKTKDSTGIGLKNLVDRYRYLSDREVIINADQKTFRVTLPILELRP